MRSQRKFFPIRRSVCDRAPAGYDRDLCMRQVLFLTAGRVNIAEMGHIGTLDEGNPGQASRDKKHGFMVELQKELLLHEHWDGTPKLPKHPCLIKHCCLPARPS